MKIFTRTSLFLLIVFSFGREIHGQSLRFEMLSQENVLDKQPILTIDQDQQGRLWFGGEYDLFVYNAHHVVNLRLTDPFFKNIEYIHRLAINKKNDLFISSSTHLYIYDIDQRKAIESNGKPFKVPLVITSIKTIEDRTFLCSKNGLYEAVPSGSSYMIKLLIKRKNVQNLAALDKERFLLASDEGIEILHVKNDSRYISTPLLVPFSTVQSMVTSILVNDQQIWIGTKNKGIYVYDLRLHTWNKLNEQTSNLLSDNIRKIVQKAAGEIWIGTLKGLCIYQKDKIFKTYKHSSENYSALSQNSIYDIFIDRQQIAWIGTYFGGLNAVYPDLIPINIYSTRSPTQFRLNSDITSSFAESSDSYWLGTEEEGLTKINKKNGEATALVGLTKSSLIKDIYINNHKVYVAQYAGGFSIIDLTNNSLRHYYIDKNTFSSNNNVFSIYADSAEKIYLGTNKGLYTYLPHQKKPQLSVDIPKTAITEIQADHFGNVYVLANKKLYRNSSGKSSSTMKETEELSINGFQVKGNGDVLLTSENNLYSYHPKEGFKLIAQFENNGLGWPFQDGDNIWITSKNGLLLYNTKTKQNNLLNQHDGLPSKNLQSAKLFRASNGNLFVTTLNGLVEIQTKRIRFNKATPDVVFQDVYVGNSILPFQRLKNNNGGYELELAYDENFITVNFSSNNSIKAQKNQYRYKLDGFDKGFQESNVPSVRYTNILPGNYTLLVYASNNDGVWSKMPMSIAIHVKPPFWKTWWAYTAYILLLLLMIRFIINFIVERKILLSSKKEQEQKIRFFTQVSHEIRTPLTLITVPMQDFVEESSAYPNLHLKAKKLQRNAQKLLQIVNELLDFRKLEVGKTQLNLTSVPIKDYMEDFFYLFADMATAKSIRYSIRRLENCGLIQIDRQQFDKVLFNLLSNALKYCREGGTVFLELYPSKSDVVLKVADNGIGISEQNLFNIFEEYYREEKTEQSLGTGIGLALTKEIVEKHNGSISCTTEKIGDENFTVFTVTLKNKISEPLASVQLIDNEIPEDFSIPPLNQVAQQIQVLIIEDNQEMSELLVDLLKDHYQTHRCPNGQQGYEKALQLVPDLIISDIMMPVMDGIALCKKLKTNEITSHIPIILLTADTNETTLLTGLENGANIYLTKPFHAKALLFSVKNLIEISISKRKSFNLIDTQSKLSPTDQHFLEKTEKIIDNNLLNPDFSVDYLSKELGMSQPVLYKKLKQITDLSVNNYIKLYRFKKAIELMNTDMNINEIAYAVGFSDRKYFSKEFKKHFGVNPSEYKP